MKGFVANQESVFRKTLSKLIEVAPRCKPSMRIWFRKVGSDVGPILNWRDFPGTPDNQEFYDQKDTNLEKAVGLFPLNLDGKRTDRPPRLHILITDGVQSLDGTLQIDFRNRCLDLVREKGWSGTILGIRGDFTGNLYSERLKARIGTFSGFRPFYCFIFSPDESTLLTNVKTLKRELKALGTQVVIQELPIGLCLSEKPLTLEAELTGNQARSRMEPTCRFEDKNDVRVFKIPIGLNMGQKLRMTFALPFTETLKESFPDETPKDAVIWELTPVPLGKEETVGTSFPVATVKDGDVKKENDRLLLTVNLDVGWQNLSGSRQWRVYRLVGSLDTSRYVPSWVGQWSTTDDSRPEFGNRTFNLKSTLQGQWENSAIPLVETYLVIGPK